MLSVRLNKELEQQLNLIAKEMSISKSQIIKESLKLYFNMLNETKSKTPYSVGKELFGKYSSGKKDLSVTYKQRLKEKLNAKNFNR